MTSKSLKRQIDRIAAADHKRAQDELRLDRKKNRRGSDARNARTHLLCWKGGLLERVGIIDEDEEVLLGAFLEVTEGLQDPVRREAWRRLGRVDFLKNGRTRRQPEELIVRFPKRPPAAVLDTIKACGFTYGKPAQSWSGIADRAGMSAFVKSAFAGGTVTGVAERPGQPGIPETHRVKSK